MNGKVRSKAIRMIHVSRYILYVSLTASVYTYTFLKLWHAERLSAACSPNSADFETSAEHTTPAQRAEKVSRRVV